jgi:hypothetical protein
MPRWKTSLARFTLLIERQLCLEVVTETLDHGDALGCVCAFSFVKMASRAARGCMCTVARLATVDDNSPSRLTTKRRVYLVGNCDSVGAVYQERVYQGQKLMHDMRHKERSDAQRTSGINDCET